MKIRQDPVTRLWVREDGAVLLPPDGYRYKKHRWTFGHKTRKGYRKVCYNGKFHLVHRIVCGAFHGFPPVGKPQVDHINRVKDDNRPSNLHWADNKENADNRDYVDKSIEKYGVRRCEDKKAYHKAHNAALAAEKKAQGLHYCKDSTGKWGWFPA